MKKKIIIGFIGISLFLSLVFYIYSKTNKDTSRAAVIEKYGYEAKVNKGSKVGIWVDVPGQKNLILIEVKLVDTSKVQAEVKVNKNSLINKKKD